MKQTVRPGTAKRMLRFSRPYAGLLAILLVAVIVDAIVGVAIPFVYKDVINNGILKGNVPLIIELAALAGVLATFGATLGLAQSYLAARVGSRVMLSLRVRLFEHVYKMPLAFFTRTQTGALVSRLNTDVGGARTAFTDILSNVVGNLITVALVFGAMFKLSWRITVASMILIPLFLFPARWWGRKLQKLTRESYDLHSSMNNLMVERFNVAGAMLAKLFGRARDEVRDFAMKAERVSDIGVTQAVYGRLFFTALIIMAYFAAALVYGWGGVLAAKHVLDVGTVVALSALVAQVYGPLMGLSNIQLSVMTALVSFDRVFEVLDLAPMIQEKPGALAIRRGPARVSFDRVSFRYPTAEEVSLASLEVVATPDGLPEKSALCDISFVAEPGQLVALVGPSGAGKTTITQLVARLYDAQSGTVAIRAGLFAHGERLGAVPQPNACPHKDGRSRKLRPEGRQRSNARSAHRQKQFCRSGPVWAGRKIALVDANWPASGR